MLSTYHARAYDGCCTSKEKGNRGLKKGKLGVMMYRA
jgi:hypothetical protein